MQSVCILCGMAEVGVTEVCDVEVVAGPGTASLVAAPPAAALSAQVSLASENERLEDLENSIYADNLVICRGMTRCFEIDREAEEPPAAWIEQMGKEAAWQEFRVAKASWMAPKDAPVALTAANKIVTNLAKARATRDAGRQGLQLNVVAVFPTQIRQYEELVIGDD